MPVCRDLSIRCRLGKSSNQIDNAVLPPIKLLCMVVKLNEGPVNQRLTEMTVPMVWALFAMMSFSAADTFFVAQLGDTQLAAMSFTFPVEMVFTSIAIGAGAGASSILARLLGANKQATARRVFTDAMLLVGVCSIIFALIGYQLIGWVFSQLGAEPELLPYIEQYMGIWYWCVPALISAQICMATLRAMGLSRLQGRIMTAMALFNVAIDPLLIFGLAGFPRMELEGAALATVIARWAGFLVVLYVLCIRHGMHATLKTSLAEMTKNWLAVLHVGLPAIGTNMIIPLANAVVVSLVSQYGSSAVAGLGVASRIEPIALVCFYALSSIMGPFFGQNFGAGRNDRMQQALRSVAVFCIGFGLVLAGILFVTADTIVAWFSDSPDVQKVAISYLTIVPISYGAYGIVMSVCAAFNGLGMPIPALVISSCRVLVLFLPLALLGQLQWGIDGLFLAAAVCNLLLGLISAMWLRSRTQSVGY